MARLRRGRVGLATTCGLVMALLILGGALIWYRPFLTRIQQPVAEIPASVALFKVTEFPLAAHQKACMASVTVTPNSRLVSFRLRPANPTPAGGPPVELTLTAIGYRGSVSVPGGYPGGSATLPIVPPPKRAVIGAACFVNLGRTTVLLDGTTEPRTVSRSTLEIDGQPKLGDVALTFLTNSPHRLGARLGDVFRHASSLTDGFVPVWGIWAIAVLAAFGVPIMMILAFYSALREDTESAG